MDDIEREVRNRLRRHIIKRGGAAEYEDEAIFERVSALLGRAVDERNPDALLLPELLDSDVEWELQTHLRLTTHRPVVGRLILLVKRRLLLPMTRWLFEYSQENFRRQQRINAVLFACIEDLAIENARLRRGDTDAASAGHAPLRRGDADAASAGKRASESATANNPG